MGIGRVIVFALLALVLIAASFATYYFVIGPKLPFSPGPDTTATARAHGTAQAQTQAATDAQATANTRISASTTAQGRANATAQANPYPPNGGTLTINDPLSNNSKGYGWEVGERDGGFCTFTGGAYHSNIPQSGVFHSCLALATSFADFAFEVQARVVSGTTSGIVFRADRTTTHLYYFIIDENGNFFLKVYFDTTFSSGQIGVVVLAGEAEFSNARVWKL